MGKSRELQIQTGRFPHIGCDITIVGSLTVLIGVIHMSPIAIPDPLRIPSALGLVFFLPGYAFVAALFPRSVPDERDPISGHRRKEDLSSQGGVTDLTRLVLSLIGSVTISSLVGVVLGLTRLPLSAMSITFGLTGVTVLCSVSAAIRRLEVPRRRRYSPSVAAALFHAGEWIGNGSRLDTATRLVVVASLVLSLGTVTYGVVAPPQAETPTELELLTENETERLTAADYPETISADGEASLFVGVTSHERDRTQFTVIVSLDRVRRQGNTSVVVNRSRVAQFETTLEPGEEWRQPYSVSPETSGTDLRLTHLLYRGDPPAEPAVENAYRTAYVWVTVD